ncbi:TNF receptor-associated factor 2-like isoform X2 [Ptychodera flava]|uniref:TNF receptor-associated factor 2-like isoform X2 n=1 Tax=Ptychodera flava TaxID=63121 RepID=UPI003969E157
MQASPKRSVSWKRLPIGDKFLCAHCHRVLVEPLQTYCGHRFCKACFDSILSISEGDQKCKPCIEEGVLDSILSASEAHPDRAISRELNELHVRCPNDGCQWQGFFKGYQEHETSCQYEEILCIRRACGRRIMRKHLTEHLEKECIVREVSCQHCKSEIPVKDLEVHYPDCSRYPVSCKYCGKENIPRDELEAHLYVNNGDCEAKVVRCKFSDVGCREMIKEGNMQEHGKRFIGEHLLMLLHTLIPFLSMMQGTDRVNDIDDIKMNVQRQDHNVKELKSKTRCLEDQISELKQEFRSTTNTPNGYTSFKGLQAILEKLGKAVQGLTNKSESMKTQLSTYEGVVAVLSSQLEHVQDKMKELERSHIRDREQIKSLEQKIKAQDRIIALKDVALAEQDLRIQSLEMASYDGVLLWKITDFSRKFAEAQSGKTLSIYSPCFYTSRHGYKMCARIYLNGDGMGKGIVLMKFQTKQTSP